MIPETERKTWTDKSASEYCSAILGKPVKVSYAPMEETGFLAKANADGSITFCDRDCPRWVFWHEAGHLADAPGSIYEIVAPKMVKIDRDMRKLAGAKLSSVSSERMAELGEEALHEVKAHLWAITTAVAAKEDDVASELIDAIGAFPQDKPAYVQAATILRSVIGDLKL
jgi:hypothetical protein